MTIRRPIVDPGEEWRNSFQTLLGCQSKGSRISQRGKAKSGKKMLDLQDEVPDTVMGRLQALA
jgi:hypothetical protein